MMIRDITQRKITEEALREITERFRNAILNSPINISAQDLNLEYTWIYNPQLGYSPDDVVGKNDYDLLPIKSAEHVIELKQRAIDTNSKVTDEVSIEVEGNTSYYDFVIVPLYNPQEEIIGVTNIVIEITEHKLLEEKMEITMNELKRSNDELERFAYVSSHDLQEPLRMVTLYSQLLERRYKDNLDSDADDFIEYIVDGANRMRQLIDDLIEYSRVTSQAKGFEKVDLEKVLDVVLHNLSISIVENNVRISHDNLPIVAADKNQMVQVFQNIISNAIKFHGQKPPEINISVQKDKKEWIFCSF